MEGELSVNDSPPYLFVSPVHELEFTGPSNVKRIGCHETSFVAVPVFVWYMIADVQIPIHPHHHPRTSRCRLGRWNDLSLPCVGAAHKEGERGIGIDGAVSDRRSEIPTRGVDCRGIVAGEWPYAALRKRTQRF